MAGIVDIPCRFDGLALFWIAGGRDSGGTGAGSACSRRGFPCWPVVRCPPRPTAVPSRIPSREHLSNRRTRPPQRSLTCARATECAPFSQSTRFELRRAYSKVTTSIQLSQTIRLSSQRCLPRASVSPVPRPTGSRSNAAVIPSLRNAFLKTSCVHQSEVLVTGAVWTSRGYR